jgi:hypothetical protein
MDSERLPRHRSYRKRWAAVFLAWLFSPPAIFITGPTIIVSAIVGVSDVLPVGNVILILCGAAFIWSFARVINSYDISDVDDF